MPHFWPGEAGYLYIQSGGKSSQKRFWLLVCYLSYIMANLSSYYLQFNWYINMSNFSSGHDVSGHFGHLVRYHVSAITRCRMDRFGFCLNILLCHYLTFLTIHITYSFFEILVQNLLVQVPSFLTVSAMKHGHLFVNNCRSPEGGRLKHQSSLVVILLVLHVGENFSTSNWYSLPSWSMTLR